MLHLGDGETSLCNHECVEHGLLLDKATSRVGKLLQPLSAGLSDNHVTARWFIASCEPV